MSLAEGPAWRGPHVPCLKGDRARGVPMSDVWRGDQDQDQDQGGGGLTVRSNA